MSKNAVRNNPTNSLKEERDWLGHCFKLQCTKYNWFNLWFQQVDRDKKKSIVPYGTNIQTISAFRDIGQGYASFGTLCGLMNMPDEQVDMPNYIA